MIAMDPTEAADSERILPAISDVFPAAEIIPTGGLVYGWALGEVILNFDEQDMVHLALLNSLLQLDLAWTQAGYSPYAVAFARV